MSHTEFEYHTQIREFHLDSFGHVNNASYLQILEDARWEFIENQGYGFDKIHELQIGPTILEVNLKFKRELTNREKIKIISRPMPFKGKISSIKQTIVNANDQICCEAEFTIGLFDMQKRKLIAPTAEWLKAVGLN